MMILWILLCVLLLGVIWQYIELKKFKVTEYRFSSAKLHADRRFAVLADLHGFTYGRKNEKLIRELCAFHPEAILIAGDMIVSGHEDSYKKAYNLLCEITKIAPVYYGLGNHESRESGSCDKAVKKTFAEYMRRGKKLGVRFLRNETELLELGEDEIAVSGLELDLRYYEKRKEIPMEKNYLKNTMGEADHKRFQILLAHNPAYSEEYAAWGADLTLCGHNHGGLIRLPGRGSLISPQLTFFPKYDGGQYEIAGKQVIVSRGLGTHTFHIRIFNRAELVLVRADSM